MSGFSCEQLKHQLQQVIVGQADVLERLVIALISGGHVLLEGPPGLAKTTAVHALAGSVHASFQRIQFTPDLMPGDLTGSEIFEPNKGSFRFQPGPLFHEIVLADEINRAPPKVQSALLEAMAEHQITVGGQTHSLPPLFMVLATQNPLENAGTYSLPEAQLDRFLFHLIMKYPSHEEEIEILRRTRQVDDGRLDVNINAIAQPKDILSLRKQLNTIHVEPSIEKYVVDLVSATRNIEQIMPEWKGMVKAGASPRGAISLLRVASARALLAERDYVIPEDVVALAVDVLRHRIVLDFSAQAEGVTGKKIIDALLQRVTAP
ncbi:MoxR-like ATPase in aerotolerance operon [hydrothermal vent metagenome]|uniref:MoxR-like ATPase in aerotolerance operon n=1 Tax=hydrothermal vent metagenome TaxID=652676 RepID=A0A3B0WYW4_9ZZZZ